MKKNFSILKIAAILAMVAVMVISLVACATGTSSAASDASGTYGEIKWTYTKDTNTLTLENMSYDASDLSTVRPILSFNNMTDEAWTDAWADERTSIKKIVIKAGISKIGDYAFAFCTALEEVSIPQTVTTIGVSAFEGTSLKSVDLPASVTEIKDRAFYASNALETVKINGDLEYLGTGCFKYNPVLQRVDAIPAVFNSGILEVIRTDNPTSVNADGTHKIVLRSIKTDASVPEEEAPVEQETTVETEPETKVETTPETEAATEEGDGKISAGTIVIIVVMALILIGLVVAVILFARYDKKHSGNTTTVRKNDKKSDKK